MDLHAKADFSKTKGKINPWLHCSGFGPYFSSRALRNNDNILKSMHLTAARTHDWALVNSGQRVVDTHFIFPLMKLDPADPSNYYFKATDSLLKLTRDAGLDILYRIGSSIEHTGSAGHFNILIPEDYDKYAEVVAGIVRHYNAGWADGFKWNIKYWEIWNEPDGTTNCWAGNGEDAVVLRHKFVKLFVTILKRLKAEFPKIQVGGPALCWAYPEYFTEILQECKKAGVAPDFISWHHYACNPDILTDSPVAMRKLCDDLGFKKTKLIIDEWHYLMTWEGLHGNPRFASPDLAMRAQEGPAGHNSIDSAAFNLYVMSKWQNGTPLDQAYYYGCNHQGHWGYMDGYGRLTKSYYSMKLMGEIVSSCDKVAASEGLTPKIATLAAWSKDGKTAYLLVTEYRGIENLINVEVKGVAKAKRVTAVALDNSRDCLPVAVDFRDGVATLIKDGQHSAAFLLKFEM